MSLRAAVCLGAAALSGCLHVDWEARREGSAKPVIEAQRLKPGLTRMEEVLRRLGPPDLALRAGLIDRFYYVSWDTSYAKLDVSAPIPLPSRTVSYDIFILSLGDEELRLARLDFDRQGVLQGLQAGDFLATNNGQYFVLDNRIVSNFLEDRSRALGIVENDDDEEDIELDAPKK